MSKFNTGDRVRILSLEKVNGWPGVNHDMRLIARRGGEHVIDHIDVWISLEGSRWLWNSGWLEHACEFDSL